MPQRFSATLVDSHCHLDFADFADELPDVVSRAVAAGVARMVTICTKLPNEPSVRAIAEAHDPVFYAAGVHPMSVADHAPFTLDQLLEIAKHPKMVGIGETGLDYHYTVESKDAQQAALRVHIEASRRTDLPLIIHSRDADEDMARILSEEYANGAYTCVMHCFSSGAELAETALDLGFYLSMSGVATFKNAVSVRDVFAAAPLDRILVDRTGVVDAAFAPTHRNVVGGF